MKASELFTALEKTGTGPFYMRIFRDVIAARILADADADERKLADDGPYLQKLVDRRAQKIDAGELIREAEAAAGVQGGNLFQVTLGKAKKIIASKNVEETIKEINGSPPKQSQEASEQRLAKILSETNGDVVERALTRAFEKQAEAQIQGVGNPGRNKPVAAG